MKVVIAGSRTITDYKWLCEAIHRSGFDITLVISGKEPKGVDQLGELWAKAHGIPVDPHPARWNLYRNQAGPIRNGEMEKVADAAIILRLPFDKKSNGSDDMFDKMKAAGKPVHREIQDEWC